MSGFIFFFLYQKKIADRTISLANFAVLRLSRLYPLHVATLLVVAFGQSCYARVTNSYYVYGFNDLYHFLLNLGLAPAWGLEKGISFNGPVWSVSIEILLYALFYVVCRARMASNLMLVALAFVGTGGLVTKLYNIPLSLGLACFFTGGLAYRAYAAVVLKRNGKLILLVALVVASIAWLMALLGASGQLEFSGTGKWEWLLKRLLTIYLLYPLTLISLALLDSHWQQGRVVASLGDISYSSYLIHFPLQLAIVTIFTKTKTDPSIFYSPLFLVGFFCVLIGLSLASHKYFEMPAQRWMRGRFCSSPASNLDG